MKKNSKSHQLEWKDTNSVEGKSVRNVYESVRHKHGPKIHESRG